MKKVTRHRATAIGEPPSLADRARALLEQREAERQAKLTRPRGGNPEAQALLRRNREPRLNIHSEERTDDDKLVVKLGRPREYNFQIKVRVYGPLPDQWDANDIVVDALRDARERARAKYKHADIWTSLLIERDPDYEGKVETEVT